MSGRNTLCDPQTIANFADGIAKGLPIKYAAMRAGIGYSTLYEWIEKAKQGLAPYTEFAEAYEGAKATRIEKLMGVVDERATRDWYAAKWSLEVMFPDDFGPSKEKEKEQTKLPPEVEKLIGVLGNLGDEKLASVLQFIDTLSYTATQENPTQEENHKTEL